MNEPLGLSTLDNLATFLNGLASNRTLEVSSQRLGEDGRTASIRNEGEIREQLVKRFKDEGDQIDGFKIKTPDGTRSWYDFALEHQATNSLVPVNIKSTNGASSDNCGSKEGVFYSLTGQLPSGAIGRDYETYFEALCAGIKEALTAPHRQTRDYYFLICLKSEGQAPRFFVQTLRSIQVLTPNGNNPPFQCAWARNQVRVERSFPDGVLFVLSAYQASMQQRAAQYFKFQAALEPLIKQLSARPQI